MEKSYLSRARINIAENHINNVNSSEYSHIKYETNECNSIEYKKRTSINDEINCELAEMRSRVCIDGETCNKDENVVYEATNIEGEKGKLNISTKILNFLLNECNPMFWLFENEQI